MLANSRNRRYRGGNGDVVTADALQVMRRRKSSSDGARTTGTY